MVHVRSVVGYTPGGSANPVSHTCQVDTACKHMYVILPSVVRVQDVPVHVCSKLLVAASVNVHTPTNLLRVAGGPLGELVQWSDIICTLYMLGHDLIITSEFEELAA